MKTLTTLLLVIFFSSNALAQSDFITRWNLATAGSGDTQLSFGVATTGTVNYTWQAVSPGTGSGSGTFTGSTATITGLPPGAVIDLRINPTNFSQISINNGVDKDRLTDVSQWGTTDWISTRAAFKGCSNLQVSATDLPNLSGVVDMSAMFSGCTILNGPANIGSWNTENVVEMTAVFAHASAFNQPIGTWNTAKVTNMLDMFRSASSFNQPISTQPNGIWNTANVTNMNGMFAYAIAFNQPIGTWDTGKVMNMAFMLSNADAFNQPIGSWNTASVTTMVNMFADAISFNQPIGTWNTAKVNNMGFMFSGASVFNQPIANWNTSEVTKTAFMFFGASAFNQTLGTWTLNASVDITSMLSSNGMDCDHYSATLIGWSANPATPPQRSLGAFGRSYGTSAADARDDLVTNKGWIITNDAASGSDCLGAQYFITRWNLATAGSGATQLTFDVETSGTVSYSWQEVSPGTASGSGTFTGTIATITGLPSGSVIDLKIIPTNFNRIHINNGVDRARLTDVSQWGATAWSSMGYAFYGCANLQISASDLPDLRNVGSMAGMFGLCTTLDGPANIGVWNTANVTTMAGMFQDATAFNQPIGNWNTGKVTFMSQMFRGAISFNQPLVSRSDGKWDTGNVTDMSYMFYQAGTFDQSVGTWNTASVTTMEWMFSYAYAFNQPIDAWDTGNVTNMSHMFYLNDVFNQPIGTWNTVNVTTMAQMFRRASAFNQPIGTWDTGNVTTMDRMFYDASEFNQSLGAWTLNAAVNLDDMFLYSGLDCDHYSATLIGWSANSATPNGRTLAAPGMLYGTNAVAERNNLITNKAWIITEDAASGDNCSGLLPVTLISFSGKKSTESQNILTWSTADEKDFDRFEIERSADAKSFEKTGMIKGGTEDGGREKGALTRKYSFLDLFPGVSNYYRLKMIDLDGSFAYSRIISIENSVEQAVVGSFYPNPSNGTVFVDIYAVEKGNWTLTITNAIGRTVGSQIQYLRKGVNKISLDRLSPGLNLVRFQHGAYSEVRKVIGE